MNFKEFTALLATNCATVNHTRSGASIILQDFVTTLREALEQNEAVKVTGVGVFKIKTLKARTAHNPRTGEAVKVKGRQKIMFKPSKKLTAAIQRKKIVKKP